MTKLVTEAFREIQRDLPIQVLPFASEISILESFRYEINEIILENLDRHSDPLPTPSLFSRIRIFLAAGNLSWVAISNVIKTNFETLCILQEFIYFLMVKLVGKQMPNKPDCIFLGFFGFPWWLEEGEFLSTSQKKSLLAVSYDDFLSRKSRFIKGMGIPFDHYQFYLTWKDWLTFSKAAAAFHKNLKRLPQNSFSGRVCLLACKKKLTKEKIRKVLLGYRSFQNYVAGNNTNFCPFVIIPDERQPLAQLVVANIPRVRLISLKNLDSDLTYRTSLTKTHSRATFTPISRFDLFTQFETPRTYLYISQDEKVKMQVALDSDQKTKQDLFTFVFASQALPENNTVLPALRALLRESKNIRGIYRPHPLETLLWKKHFIGFPIDVNPCIGQTLSRANVFITHSSKTFLDALLFDRDIIVFDPSEVPRLSWLIRHGLALHAKTKVELKTHLMGLCSREISLQVNREIYLRAFATRKSEVGLDSFFPQIFELYRRLN